MQEYAPIRVTVTQFKKAGNRSRLPTRAIAQNTDFVSRRS